MLQIDKMDESEEYTKDKIYIKTKGTCLSINSGRLSFPDDILIFSKLTVLDLSNNCFMYLPAELGNLTQLKSLNLNGNCLVEFPVFSFAYLFILSLAGNPFMGAVDTTNMPVLATLYLSYHVTACTLKSTAVIRC
jgi:Leucine-rich repeat (LRR) protein